MTSDLKFGREPSTSGRCRPDHERGPVDGDGEDPTSHCVILSSLVAMKCGWVGFDRNVVATGPEIDRARGLKIRGVELDPDSATPIRAASPRLVA
jgi:hypothetical protein